MVDIQGQKGIAENPLVSIVVPVYNVEKYLDRCINSIISQTYNNIEIFLVDDGSPDNCGMICDQYAKKYSSIHVIHQENAGQAAARNHAVQKTTGEYIVFIDSDNISYVGFPLFYGLEKTVFAKNYYEMDFRAIFRILYFLFRVSNLSCCAKSAR